MVTLSRRGKSSILLIFLIILLSLFAVGCDEFGLLENLDSDPTVRIALDDGGLSPGDTIELGIDFQDNPPDRVTARLEQDGETFLDLEVVSPADGWENQTGATGGLHIPAEVPEGRYVLITEAWFGDKLIAEQSTDLYVILGDWKIEGLDSFPPQGVPGGIFYVSAGLEIPEDSDPWIRWVWEDSLIAEGLFSEGWDEVVFKTGDGTGMGSLIVELHPGRPKPGEIPVKSMQTELYTLPSLPPEPFALEPSESYSILLQFDGTLGDEPRPEIIGKPRPVVIGDDTGLRFSDGAGLRWEKVPSDVINSGAAEPFSLSFGFWPDSAGSGKILGIDDDEGFSLLVSQLSAEQLSVQVNGDSLYSSTFFLPKTDLSPMNVTISFLPSSQGLALAWKIDGDTIFTDYWDTVPLIEGENLNISLGTEDGFAGVLTRFGIHVRDAKGNPASEGDRFAFYRDRDELMLIAEGFEDNDVADQIEVDSEIIIDSGSLMLPPDSSVRFPAGGGGSLAIGNLSGKDRATLSVLDPVSGEILDSILVNDEFYSDSPYRISILLEKIKSMSDNETEVVYELKNTSENESTLRLEHILAARE